MKDDDDDDDSKIILMMMKRMNFLFVNTSVFCRATASGDRGYKIQMEVPISSIRFSIKEVMKEGNCFFVSEPIFSNVLTGGKKEIWVSIELVEEKTPANGE